MSCVKFRRNRWVIDFYDQDGKRRWKTMPEEATKQNAKDELRAIEDRVKKHTYLPTKEIPLFKEVVKDWLEHKKPKVRITTWEVMEGHTKKHFKEFDEVKVNQITTAAVERYITSRQNQGMKINTLRKILVTLGQVFAYAVRHKYMDGNPMRDAERPMSQTSNEPAAKDKIKVLTPEQINALLDSIMDRQFHCLVRLAIFSGARQGELLGLRWQDIDWQSSQIRIERTFNMGRFFNTKTRESNRRIDIGPGVLTELKEWKLACPMKHVDLVFPNVEGGPIDHHNLINRQFIPALVNAGIARKLENGKVEGKIRFHDLRHTFASLLIEQGENIKYVQSQLGHSSPTVTLNVYAHLMKPSNQAAACRLEDAILGGHGSKMVAVVKK
jgi:integrase